MSRGVRQAVLGGAIAATAGCAGPLEGPVGAGVPGMEEVVGLEANLNIADERREHAPGTQTAVEEALSDRRGELDAIGPAPPGTEWDAAAGPDLLGATPSATGVTLSGAVASALAHNLDLAVARIAPAISRESMQQAEAAFDFVLGAGVTRSHVKTPQQRALVDGVAVTAEETESDRWALDGSLARKLHAGGTVTLSTDLTRSSSGGSGVTYEPDPAWDAVATLDLAQPLLRNFGTPVARSQVRLAHLAHRRSIETLRQSMHQVVTDTELAWWNLALQWKTLQVQTWLLDAGTSVASVLDRRRDYDAGMADYAQAVATVEQRRTSVIRQQQAVQEASDALKALTNDPAAPLNEHGVLQPAGRLEAGAIAVSLREAVLAAMANRPDLRELTLTIDTESIDLEVAANARLPLLDLQAQVSFKGLDGSGSDAYSEAISDDYLNYLVGLRFEYPLGNRAAEARHRQARLERASAMASYDQALQQAVLEVRNAVRDIITEGALVDASRSSRIAQAEHLRTLRVEEVTLADLTPTFLNLKLTTQARLAEARIAEFRAVVDFNRAIATLHRATGMTLDAHQVEIDMESAATWLGAP